MSTIFKAPGNKDIMLIHPQEVYNVVGENTHTNNKDPEKAEISAREKSDTELRKM